MAQITNEYAIYLISFIGIRQHFMFDGGTPETLGNIIKANNKNGVNFIKVYEPARTKFTTIPKKEIQNLFGWDTHSIIELQKTNFLK